MMEWNYDSCGFILVRTKYLFTKVRKSGFSYRKSWYFLLWFSKSLTNHSHLRTRPRYWWDNSKGENSITIGWLLEELSCKRPDGRPDILTDSRVYSLFEYTKIVVCKLLNFSRCILWFVLFLIKPLRRGEKKTEENTHGQ